MTELLLMEADGIPDSADASDFIDIPKGMRWECQMCGSCCGNVFSRYWIDVHLSEYVGDTSDGFCKYLNREGGNRCGRYGTRPNICRGYPFIIKRNGDHYSLTVHKKCPGIGKGARLDVHERLIYTLRLVEDDLDIDFIVTRTEDNRYMLFRIK